MPRPTTMVEAKHQADKDCFNFKKNDYLPNKLLKQCHRNFVFISHEERSKWEANYEGL